MKVNPQVLQLLNERLAEELTAINMYMVHAEMCANWGFNKLHEAFQKQAIDEMHHAEMLIGRILFLEGSPTVSRLNPLKIAAKVEDMLVSDEDTEAVAIKNYNDTITACAQVGDNGTREMIAKILLDEERHIDWAKTQRELLAQMGLQNYLQSQS